MSRGFSRDVGEATRAGFGHGFAGGRSAVAGARDPVPPYWITAQSNCPEFSLEFPIKLPEQARAIRIAEGSEVFGADKEAALEGLLRKYSSEFFEAGLGYIRTLGEKTRVYRIDIDHLTGKARRA